MDGRHLRSFLEPCLLLLLRERPDHGYNLVERLQVLGVTSSEPPRIYRALRALERENLVRSEWCPSRCGPARRTYHLTREGCEMLGTWVHVAEETRDALDGYLTQWAQLQEPGNQAEPFPPERVLPPAPTERRSTDEHPDRRGRRGGGVRA